MIQIRPVSDLRNKYTEIEKTVLEGDPVYLTKNGYGTMVVLSIESYSKLLDNVDYMLDISDQVAKESKTRYSHDEIFTKLRGAINEA